MVTCPTCGGLKTVGVSVKRSWWEKLLRRPEMAIETCKTCNGIGLTGGTPEEEEAVVELLRGNALRERAAEQQQKQDDLRRRREENERRRLREDATRQTESQGDASVIPLMREFEKSWRYDRKRAKAIDATILAISNKNAAEPLVGVLNGDWSNEAKHIAIRALAQLGQAGVLVRLLGTVEDYRTKETLIFSLGNIKNERDLPTVVQALIPYLKYTDAGALWVAAAGAFATLPPQESAVPALVELCRQVGHDFIIKALLHIRSPHMYEYLMNDFLAGPPQWDPHDAAFNRKRDAYWCISKIVEGLASPAMESTFLDVLDNPNSRAQLSAVEILGKIGGPKTAARLLQILESEIREAEESGKPLTISFAARALGSLGEPRAVANLVNLAQVPWSAGLALRELVRILEKNSGGIDTRELETLARMPDLHSYEMVTDDSPWGKQVESVISCAKLRSLATQELRRRGA
jgi:HEAT repeat protein